MADLIERYKITANLPSVMMNYCNKFNSKQIELITEMIYELENSIESADVQPVNQWISCKDKMPEHGVTVLIYAGNHMIMLAWYDKDMEYFYICDSDYKYNPLDVTHWQPLPEPPTNMRGEDDAESN